MEEPIMTNAERVEMYLKAIADTLKGETPQLDGYTYTKMEEWLAYIITVLQENGGGSGGSGGTTNYNQLTNKPFTNKTGTDSSPIYLRELQTGAYILNGTCSPYNGSETYMGANNAVTFVNYFDTVTAIQIFYPPYNQVQYFEVYDDNYTTNTVRLNDLPTKEYVDSSIANAIGTALEGSY